MNFDNAFEALIGHEGGYVNHKKDPGGETKYGISKRQYPLINIRDLTLDTAKAIYKRDYWNKVRGDELPYDIAFEVFDAAVNHGVGRATKWMQGCLDVNVDGLIGPKTLAAASTSDLYEFRCRFNGTRLLFFTDLKTWESFGRGWARRVANNLLKP